MPIADLVAVVVDRLSARPAGTGPLLVGIDGAGGAGKSTFAVQLASLLQARRAGTAIVRLDDFYRPSAQRGSDGVGADFDWERLRDQVLLPLSVGQGARYQLYDWGADALADWRDVSEAPVVLIEGVYVLRRELRPLYDLRVWIECPRGVRLARGIARDGEGARATWEQAWMPQEDRYIAAHEPHLSAHFVFRGDRADWDRGTM